MAIRPRSYPLARVSQDFVARAAASALPVLIRGETGTGKSVLAEIIHDLSPRSSKPIVSVGCGALAGELLTRELFGNVRGAFTGADRDAPGLVEEADGGTLVLDDVDALPLDLQPKILGLADGQPIRRLGATKSRDVDVRLICTTNKDLEAEVGAGRFRSDLYFRLAMRRHRVPPLRDRLGELPELVTLLSDALQRAEHPDDQPPDVRIHPAALELLKAYSWPGNFRELTSVLASAMAEWPSSEIEPEFVRAAMADRFESWPGPGPWARERRWRAPKPRYELTTDEETERAAIIEALAQANGVKKKAADLLGMSRQTLWMRERLYGIEPEEWS